MMCELKKTSQIEVDGFLGGSPGVPYVGYLADISNDGKSFSNTPALYIIHDSKCMDCRPITGICKVKASAYFPLSNIFSTVRIYHILAHTLMEQ